MAIEAINVKFSYKRKEVYSDLNLNIKTPQAYLLLGKNGVGKTTLLKLVSGLLEPLKGQVLFNSLAVFPRDPLNLMNLFLFLKNFHFLDCLWLNTVKLCLDFIQILIRQNLKNIY